MIGQLRKEIEQRRARAVMRSQFAQQIGGGNVERLRDGTQYRDRWIAGAAFDLREISLRSVRSLRQLPARHAALGAAAPHFAAERREKAAGPPPVCPPPR